MFGWLTRWRTPKQHLADDRRVAERHPCGLAVNDRLMVSVGFSSWPAIVRDISTTGIGLILGIRHDPGTSLPIDLFCTSSGFSRKLRMQIVRTERLPDGSWFCGCAFDEQLIHDEIQRLI